MNHIEDFSIFTIINETAKVGVKFIKQDKKVGAKTEVYNVNKNGVIIGQVKWSSRMRGYGFLPTSDCDVEVKEFIKDVMAKRRADKKKEKK